MKAVGALGHIYTYTQTCVTPQIQIRIPRIPWKFNFLLSLKRSRKRPLKRPKAPILLGWSMQCTFLKKSCFAWSLPSRTFWPWFFCTPAFDRWYKKRTRNTVEHYKSPLFVRSILHILLGIQFFCPLVSDVCCEGSKRMYMVYIRPHEGLFFQHAFFCF